MLAASPKGASRTVPILIVLFTIINTSLGAPSGFWTSQYRGTTGAKMPSAQEQAWMEKNLRKVTTVQLNARAIGRIEKDLSAINSSRQASGLSPITAEMLQRARAQAASASAENMGPIGSPTASYAPPPAGSATAILASGAPTVGAALPRAVDNSTLPSFPEIRNQGSLGSCVSFSIAYSQLSHEVGMLAGWNNKNSDNSTKFSPKFLYNIVNWGYNNGSSWYDNYNLIKRHGAPTWEQYPYEESAYPETSYLQWCLDPDTWLAALNYRIREWGDLSGTLTTTWGMDNLKTMLANGHVLTGGLFAFSFVNMAIKDDPSTTADDAWVNKTAIAYVDGYQGGHSMTIVGYNDDIWVDLNQNNIVDAGEKGALRLANSWGTYYEDNGYVWVAYDALFPTTQVTGGPVGTGSRTQFFYAGPYWITAQNSYSPRLVAKVTVNHALRNQMSLSFTGSDISNSLSNYLETSLSYSGGPYAFNGTTTPVDGTFYFDLSDLIPSTIQAWDYKFNFNDGYIDPPGAGIVKEYSLIDLAHGGSTVSTTDALPRSVDGGSASFTIRYTFGDANLPPVANAGADLTVNLTTPVTLDGRGSSDPDNGPSPLSYSWSQIAGTTISLTGATTAQPGFTPTVAGSYTFRLTVSDGALSSSDDVVVTVIATPVAISLPGRIQAEEYRTGGEGVGYHDLTNGNTGGQYRTDNVDIEACTDVGGGYNVGWIDAGEWLAYDVHVTQSGLYKLTARMASQNAGTKTVTVAVDGAVVATFNTTTASGWQAWSDAVVDNVNLTAGDHVLRVNMTTGGHNFNYLDVAPVTTTPGVLQLSSAAYSVAENGGSATITINRVNGTSGDVTVNYATSNGTATAGSDFTSQSGSLTFASGVTSQTFSIPILDDQSVEGDETVNIALISPTGGATLGTPNTAVLTINDNDQLTGITLPGKIEAEEYKAGGEGAGYHDLTSGNTGGQYRTDNVDIEACTDVGGGYNVGWIDAGEWLAYDVNVTESGLYKLTARMASQNAGTKSINVSVDGVTVATLNTTTASGWQAWTDAVIDNVNLTAGNHVLRITMTTGGHNLNYLDVARIGTPSVVFAVNCAGGAVSGADGVTYGADKNFTGGQTATTGAAIANTTDDALYQSERWGACSYAISGLANATYRVTLKFAETFWNATGKRVFDVKAEGQTILDELDIFATSGAMNTAYDVSRTVTVTDGTLNLEFADAAVDQPKICAIVVTSTGATAPVEALVARLPRQSSVPLKDAIRFQRNGHGVGASFEISLARPTHVSLRIFDAAGREVARLAERSFTAGVYTLPVSQRLNSNGLFVYRYEAGSLKRSGTFTSMH